MTYNRQKAIKYALTWALSRNPVYMDFSEIGGDCTSFVSQCLKEGGLPYNHTKTFGWYYKSPIDRAPAWSSAKYLYEFLVNNKGVGPKGQDTAEDKLKPGDIIQLSFRPKVFSHSLFVLSVDKEKGEDGILVAAHTDDSLNRSLSTYAYIEKRYIKILG